MLALVFAVVLFWLLALVHGAARWLAARAVGMRVGPVALRFGLRVGGLGPAKDAEAAADPRAYPNRPAWQRAVVLFAAPLAYWLVAATTATTVFLATGVPTDGKRPVVDEVISGMPAAAAGFMPGDAIVSIDGEGVDGLDAVSLRVAASGGRPIRFEVLRNGEPRTLTVEPVEVDGTLRIGIAMSVEQVVVRGAVGAAFAEGLRFPTNYARFFVTTFAKTALKWGKRQLFGPVGIMKEMHRSVESGPKRCAELLAIFAVLFGLFALTRSLVSLARWELAAPRRVPAGGGG